MNLRPADLNHPGADLPTKAELNQIRPGFFVKLSLTSGEFFWAQATSCKRANGTFTGAVESKPVTALNVKLHDAVIFEKRHVFEIV